MNLACLLGHDFDDWRLHPPLIGARVEWLYWQSTCRRTWTDRGRLRQCGAIRQRWFRVRIPGWAKLPDGVKHAIPVAKYMERIRATAPDPESLRDGRAPTKQQLGDLGDRVAEGVEGDHASMSPRLTRAAWMASAVTATPVGLAIGVSPLNAIRPEVASTTHAIPAVTAPRTADDPAVASPVVAVAVASTLASPSPEDSAVNEASAAPSTVSA